MERTPFVLSLTAAIIIFSIATFAAATRKTLYDTPVKAALASYSDPRDDDAVEVATIPGRRTIVLTAAPRGDRRLALSVLRKQGDGWYVIARSESKASLDDIDQVGSLLITDLGDPPFLTAVFGELSDPQVQQVSVLWNDGLETDAQRVGDGYVVTRTGTPKPEKVTYRNSAGQELSFVQP